MSCSGNAVPHDSARVAAEKRSIGNEYGAETVTSNERKNPQKEKDMTASNKKGFGVYVTCAAILAALIAGIYFIIIHGKFGLDSTHNGDCYDPLIVGLLIGGAVIACVLILLKRYGLASAVACIAPGAAICVFLHKCYWYVVDVFVGIDEKHGFDPKFWRFVGFLVAAFLIGEIAIYCRKVKKA